MKLFSYLITDCCFDPTEADLNRLNCIKYYIEDIFYDTDKYSALQCARSGKYF
jgi:hypothetical protein